MFGFNADSAFEKLLSEEENVISIRKKLYKKLVKSNPNYVCGDFCLELLHSSFEKSILAFHITNNELAHSLYEIARQGITLPEIFQGIKFVLVDKEQKAVFLLCKKGYHFRLADILPDLIKNLNAFCTALSSDKTKLYINYSTFFEYIFERNCELTLSLLLSLDTTQASFAKENFDNLISSIMKWSYSDSESFEELKELVKTNKQKFFYWIRRGVYIPDLAGIYLYHVPVALSINIVKYCLDENAFNSVEELFTFEEYYTPFTQGYIFDSNRFNKDLTFASENEEFKTFSLGHEYSISELKDSSLLEGLRNLTNATNEDYDGPDSYVFMDKEKRVFLLEHVWVTTFKSWCSTEAYKWFSLYDALDASEDVFVKLMLAVIQQIVFSDDSLFYNSPTDLLKSLCVSKPKDYEIGIYKRYNLVVKPTDNSINLNHPGVLLEMVREYMARHSINIVDIYDHDFIKILPPVFVSQLQTYLDTGEIPKRGLKTALEKCLDADHYKDIIFVENFEKLYDVSSSNLDLMSITFFDDATPFLSLKALNCFKDLEKFCYNKQYIDLNSKLKYITSRDLCRMNLKDIFKTPNSQLGVKKVFISKEVTADGYYKIVGLEWSHTSLISFMDLLIAGKVDTKLFYKCLADILRAYVNEDLDLRDDTISYNLANVLLFDTKKQRIVFNVYGLSNLKRYSSSVKDYYNYLTETLKPANSQIDIFDFFDLVDRSSSKSNAVRLKEFVESANNLSYCYKHKHYYTSSSTCPVCRNYYYKFEDNAFDKVAWENSLVPFYWKENLFILPTRLHKDYTKHLDEVLKGIENKLYSNIFGFSPIRIAYQKTDSFYEEFGIICEHVKLEGLIDINSFKQIQRLKVILTMYKELLPRISNGSFITNHPEIFDTLAMHKEYKGRIIIPHIFLLDSSAILADDGQAKAEKIKNTKTLFSSFLCNYIMKDEYLANMINSKESLFVNILEDIRKCNFNEAVILDCIEAYQNYCLTHRVNFHSGDTMCPLCKQDGIKDEHVMFLTEEYFETLSKSEPLYDGGEANLYHYSDDEVLKVFKNTVDLKFKSQILAKAIEKRRLIEEFNEAHEDIKIITVNKIFYSKNGNNVQLKGFTQPLIEGSFKISSLKDKEFIQEHEYERADILRILIRVCKGIEFLHSIGGFIGDLNGGNVIIRDDTVYIIDIDGMSFDDVRNSVYTNMYIYPPSAENKNITKDDDWYSLAVQAFYYLTYSHPFRGICDSKDVPISEIERMPQGLSVLGNHGIETPSISIGWAFLPDYLVQFFLDTFEGPKRESMISVLQRYYEEIPKNPLKLIKINRTSNVLYELSEHSYISDNYMLMYKNRELVNVRENTQIFSTEEDYIVVLMPDFSYILQENTGSLFKLESLSNKLVPLDICNDKVYFTSPSRDTLYVTDFSSDLSHTIRRDSSNPIMALSVVDNDKFVFVERNDSTNSYDIFCNTIKLHSVDRCSFSGETYVQVHYDSLSRKWLVLFSDYSSSLGVIIEKDKEGFDTFKLDKSLFNSSCFLGNVLYYVNEKEIFAYNIVTKTLNSIQCKVATADSVVLRKDNKFVIKKAKELYMYVKS